MCKIPWNHGQLLNYTQIIGKFKTKDIERKKKQSTLNEKINEINKAKIMKKI